MHNNNGHKPVCRLETVDLDSLQITTLNPRSDPEEDLDGLVISIENNENLASSQQFVQPPIVSLNKAGEYTLIAGERRIRAAREAGWRQAVCLVYENIDLLMSHDLRLIENLHRRQLSSFDKAVAFKVKWLIENAKAMNLTAAVAEILQKNEGNLNDARLALAELLSENGFIPTNPHVTWDQLLDNMGVDMGKEKRKKLLRVLSVDSSIQEVASEIPMTEASLRAIGTLEPEHQKILAQQLREDPDLARKSRRIARVIRDQDYSIEEAIAEAKGDISFTLSAVGEDEDLFDDEDNTLDNEAEPDQPVDEDDEDDFDEELIEVIMLLLESTTSITNALKELRERVDNIDSLPSPWNGYVKDAITLVQNNVLHVNTEETSILEHA